MDYQVGDKVIHWNYGLGEIIGLDEKFIHERQMLCYVVRIRDLTIWVEAEDTSGSSLRLPTPGGDFENLFTILHSPGEPLPIDRFERKIQLSDRMKDGKLVSICSVVRDLSFYRQAKKLNYNDKSTLDRAVSFLLDEWMFSLSVSLAQANSELGHLLAA